MAGAGFLRRLTGMAMGFYSGGASTGWDRQPQRVDLTKIVQVAGTAGRVSAILPKGSVIIAAVIIPYVPNVDDTFAVASAGSIKIGTTAGGTDILALTSASAYSRTAISGGTQLAADTRIFIEANGSLVGVAKAGVEVILPHNRP